MLGLLNEYLEDLYDESDAESEEEEDDEDKRLEQTDQKGKKAAKDGSAKGNAEKDVDDTTDSPPSDELNSVEYFSSDDSYEEDERPVRRMPWREQDKDH